jgi:hypothetical protein
MPPFSYKLLTKRHRLPCQSASPKQAYVPIHRRSAVEGSLVLGSWVLGPGAHGYLNDEDLGSTVQ